MTKTIYRLASVVCHYGDHSFGHYVCYRRKPKPRRGGKSEGEEEERWEPPRVVEPLPPSMGFGFDDEKEFAYCSVVDRSMKYIWHLIDN